jgi:protein transport protein SEC31
MKEDYEALIKGRSLSKWPETLAILLTYARADFPRLCCALAERLHRSAMAHAATICYICAANVDAAIQLWLHESREAAMPVPQLQRVLEKSIALGLATRDPSAAHNHALADLIANYALQLANQGCLASALKYLVIPNAAPADGAPTLAVLKERVYKSAAPDQVRLAKPPTSIA